jgi:hypothetical protein
MLEEEAVTVLVCYEGARIFYRTKLGGQCTNVGAIKYELLRIVCWGLTRLFYLPLVLCAHGEFVRLAVAS